MRHLTALGCALLAMGCFLAPAGSMGGGSRATGGYPYADATPVDLGKFDWGYTSCRGFCSSPAARVPLDGTTYYVYSERGYAIRNCTDYVAWKLESLGVSPALTRGRRDAKQWDASSKAVTITDVPEVGDAAVWHAGTWGHVAFVEEVRQSGGDWQVKVSQYNRGDTGWGNYSYSGWTSADDYIDFNQDRQAAREAALARADARFETRHPALTVP